MGDQKETFTPAELAERWSQTVGHLSNIRQKGGRCPFTRIGRSIIYLRKDVEAYEDSNRMLACSVKAPAAGK